MVASMKVQKEDNINTEEKNVYSVLRDQFVNVCNRWNRHLLLGLLHSLILFTMLMYSLSIFLIIPYFPHLCIQLGCESINK